MQALNTNTKSGKSMDKGKIIVLLFEHYNSFANYINRLTIDEYSFHDQQKWTAAQQLEHIVLCVKPLVQVFSMDKVAIEKTFGKTDNKSRSYDEVLAEYTSQLEQGGKAPERYLSGSTLPGEKQNLMETLLQNIETLSSRIELFTEVELDSLQIPHPLLGSLTLREMLYNAIYHVQHHHQQAQRNLEKKK